MLPARFDVLRINVEAAITDLLRMGESVRSSLFNDTGINGPFDW